MSKKDWIKAVLYPQYGAYGTDEAQKHEFGSLGNTWYRKNKIPFFDKLYKKKYRIDENECRELKVVYKYLTQAIRNRDAHTYVQNKRSKDFPAVNGIFVPAFNTLVRTMKDNGHFKTITNN